MLLPPRVSDPGPVCRSWPKPVTRPVNRLVTPPATVSVAVGVAAVLRSPTPDSPATVSLKPPVSKVAPSPTVTVTPPFNWLSAARVSVGNEPPDITIAEATALTPAGFLRVSEPDWTNVRPV